MYILISSILIICILIININFTIEITSRLGVDSLKYYVFHPFIILAADNLFSQYNVQRGYPSIVLLTLFIFLLITIFNKTKFSSIILNPVSYLIAKTK